MYIFIRKLSQN